MRGDLHLTGLSKLAKGNDNRVPALFSLVRSRSEVQCGNSENPGAGDIKLVHSRPLLDSGLDRL